MRFFQPVLALIFCLFFGNDLMAQTARIHGKVSSASGETLAGVTLLLTGTQKGAMTDLDGDYEIKNIRPGNYLLKVSYIGFQSREENISLTAGEELELNLVLQEKTEEINEVTVLGRSITGQVREQAYMVSAISTKELYNSTSDAQQVLNRVPGVRILEEGGLGSAVNFTLNGFSGDQVKFFMDGLPMDHFGSALGLNDIPVNSIDRIEVYKGVVPVWLGTDALGGAVNIITNQGANFLDASYSVGSFNTHRASVNGAFTRPESGFTFRGNVNYNYSENDYKVWIPITKGTDVIETEVERFHDRYRSVSAKIETGLVNKRYADQLLLGLLAAANDDEVQHGATMNSVYGGVMRNSQSVIPTLKYSKKDLFIRGLDVNLYGAYNITKEENIDTLRGVDYNWLGEATFTPGSNDGEIGRRTFTTNDDEDFSSRFNAGYEINGKHSIALNYSYSHFSRETFDAENPNRIENQFPKSLAKQVGGLAYKFDPNEKWSTTLFGKYYNILAEGSKQYDFGLVTQRVDSFEASQDNLGYGLATSYFLLPGLQLKASFEHTYRMPTATEMFGDGLFISPNPDLGPEQSDNFNFGAGYNFNIKNNHFFSLGSSFIYRNAQDLIYQVVTVASPQTRFDNLSETRTIGVEGNFNYEWGDIFRLGGNITYQDITDQADFVYNESFTNTGYQRNFQKGFRLPNTPYFFGNANAGLTFRNVFSEEAVFNVLYRYNYVEEYFLSWAELGSRDSKKIIPTQSSHDLEFSYSLNSGKYNVSLEVRNLTDERLYDKYFLQKPGRAFYLKVRYAL